MKITPVTHIKGFPNKDLMKDQQEGVTKKEETMPAPADTYEKSKPEDKSFVYDKASIDQLKRVSEQHYDNLIRMVEDLLKKQGMSLNKLKPDDVIKVDEATRAEAAELVSPDGPLGVEAVSDNIVNFAKAISGGDKSKLATLKDAISKGFSEVEKILGELPEISKQTYDRVMEKLDLWENE